MASQVAPQGRVRRLRAAAVTLALAIIIGVLAAQAWLVLPVNGGSGVLPASRTEPYAYPHDGFRTGFTPGGHPSSCSSERSCRPSLRQIEAKKAGH